MKTVIEMAKQAGLEKMSLGWRAWTKDLERLVELARADEREQGQKWFDAVTAQHKQEILAEREACAKECKFGRSSADIEQAIRARGQRSDGASIRSNT